jgi:hypothetical protein
MRALACRRITARARKIILQDGLFISKSMQFEHK